MYAHATAILRQGVRNFFVRYRKLKRKCCRKLGLPAISGTVGVIRLFVPQTFFYRCHKERLRFCQTVDAFGSDMPHAFCVALQGKFCIATHVVEYLHHVRPLVRNRVVMANQCFAGNGDRINKCGQHNCLRSWLIYDLYVNCALQKTKCILNTRLTAGFFRR
jgi:hypothetical protein